MANAFFYDAAKNFMFKDGELMFKGGELVFKGGEHKFMH